MRTKEEIISTETAIKCLKTEKGCVNMDCKFCTENKKCYLQQLIEENEKLKQALEEIREKATRAVNSNDCYVRMYAGKMYCQPIIDIINKVLEIEEIEE